MTRDRPAAAEPVEVVYMPPDPPTPSATDAVFVVLDAPRPSTPIPLLCRDLTPRC